MKRLFTSILFLLIILPLTAASYNLALVKEGNNKYFDEIKEVSEFILSYVTINDSSLIEKVYLRDDAYQQRQNEIKNHNSSNVTELTLSEKEEEIGASLKEIQANEFLLSLDTDALDHALLVNNVDALIIPIISPYNSLTEVEVYYYDGEVSLILHTMLMQTDILFEGYSIALINKLNLNYGILKIEDSVSGLKILKNKEDVHLYGSYILEEAGNATYSLTAPYYVDKNVVISVDKGILKKGSFDLQRKDHEALLISSIPTNATVIVNNKEEFALPHLFTSLERPTVLTIQSDGYEQKLLHITEEENNLIVNLTPSLIVDDNRLENAKKRMYKSMRNTLFSFGFTVASMSIENIYKDDIGNTLLPLTIGFSGATIISLLDFIDSVVDYYNTAKERL